jgi:phosphomannomutase
MRSYFLFTFSGMSMCSETASKDYSSAFRTYDIRSIYDQPIDTTFAYSLGKALGKHLSDTKGSQASMVIAADTRKANNDLVSYFLQGVMESGISYLWNLGQPVGQERTRGVGSTAMVYRMTQQVFDMGVMFTASHNPAEYVGMKVVDHEGDLIPTEQLRERISTYESPTDPVDPATVLAKLNRHDRLAKQVDQVMYDLKDRYERLYSELRHKRKVLVDYSGGSGVGYEQAFLRWIETQGWVEFIAINDLPDSEFSAHLSDTSDVVNYEQLQAAVRLHEADMGIMFDGDADRLGFVDEQGAYVLGDVAGAVIARRLLESAGENSPKTIIAEVSCTHALEEIAAKHG